MMDGPAGDAPEPLRVLVVDDEAPAREDLAYLLREDARIGTVRTAPSAAHALKVLNDEPVDVVFCDIKMPGLDGMELARVITRFADRDRRSCSSPPTTTTPSTRSNCTPPTTS